MRVANAVPLGRLLPMLRDVISVVPEFMVSGQCRASRASTLTG
jgi:hypothetical protein